MVTRMRTCVQLPVWNYITSTNAAAGACRQPCEGYIMIRTAGTVAAGGAVYLCMLATRTVCNR
jgi:hypothetical protein